MENWLGDSWQVSPGDRVQVDTVCLDWVLLVSHTDDFPHLNGERADWLDELF